MVNNLVKAYRDIFYLNAATNRMTLNDVLENNRPMPIFLDHGPDCRCRGFLSLFRLVLYANKSLFIFHNPILDVLSEPCKFFSLFF